MRLWQLLLVGSIAVAVSACERGEDKEPPRSDQAQSFGELTVDQVAEKIGKPGVFVFDNNPRHEWEQGHVPGATWVDYKALTAADLPADKGATLIFYCKNEH